MINPSLIRKLPYDTVRDFTPLGLIVDVPAAMVVHPSLPVKSLKEFIALAKALQDPANRKSLLSGGAEPVGNGIDEHAAFIKSEIAKWQKVAKAAGIEPRDP